MIELRRDSAVNESTRSSLLNSTMLLIMRILNRPDYINESVRRVDRIPFRATYVLVRAVSVDLGDQLVREKRGRGFRACIGWNVQPTIFFVDTDRLAIGLILNDTLFDGPMFNA